MVRLVQRATGMTGTDLLRELARLGRQRFREARERMVVCLDSVVRWANADVAIWLEPMASPIASGWEVMAVADRADFIRAGEVLPAGLGGVEDRMWRDPGRLVLGPSEFPERQPLLLCRWAWQDAGWVAVQDDRLRHVGVLGIGFRSGVRGGMWTAPLVAAVEVLAQNCALRPAGGDGFFGSSKAVLLPADRGATGPGPAWCTLGERGMTSGAAGAAQELGLMPEAPAVRQWFGEEPSGVEPSGEEPSGKEPSGVEPPAARRTAAIGDVRLADAAGDRERAAAGTDLLGLVDLLRPVVNQLLRAEDQASPAPPGGGN